MPDRSGQIAETQIRHCLARRRGIGPADIRLVVNELLVFDLVDDAFRGSRVVFEQRVIRVQRDRAMAVAAGRAGGGAPGILLRARGLDRGAPGCNRRPLTTRPVVVRTDVRDIRCVGTAQAAGLE